MPETAKEHDEEEVHIGASGAFAVAAEWDVEVVTQPAGKRHVPATPEFGDAGGEVGEIEVGREFVAEHGS